MEKSESEQLTFTRIKSRQVKADFGGREVSSDGGLPLVREVDRALGLVQKIARRLMDPRESGKVRHENGTMLRQRVMALIAGWQDLNDAATLRAIPCIRSQPAAMKRWRAHPRYAALRTGRTVRRRGLVNQAPLEQFIGSHAKMRVIENSVGRIRPSPA